MNPEQFRAILAKHGGLIGTQVLDQAKEESISGVKTGEYEKPPSVIRLKYVTPNGEITAYQKDDGTYQIVDDPKGLVKSATADAAGGKPMTEYERAQLDRQKEQDARAARNEQRSTNQQTIQNNRADRRERGQQKLQELQLAVQQGSLDERKAQAEWERWKFQNYDLPRQQRADALAERNAARADAREDRMITTEQRRARTDEYKVGQEAGRDAVDRARLAHTPVVLGNYAKGGIDAAWATPAPDFDAIARSAAERAVAELRGLGQTPPANPTAAGDGLPSNFQVPPPAAPPSGLVATPATRDQYAR